MRLSDFRAEADQIPTSAGARDADGYPDLTGWMAMAPSVDYLRKRYPNLGKLYPALSPFLQDGMPSLPYTQWEAWLALHHGKMLLVALPEPAARRDAGHVLDPIQRRAQDEHLQRLAGAERGPEILFGSADDLAIAVALKSPLARLLREAARPLALSPGDRNDEASRRHDGAPYEYIRPDSFGENAPDPYPAIPELLRHLVDRTPQVTALRAAVTRSLAPAASTCRPLVVVVLGGSEDDHEGLVRVFREDILPRVQRASPLKRQDYRALQWPPSGYSEADLRADLAGALEESIAADDARLRRRLTTGAGAQSIAYFIHSAEWSPRDGELLLQWIRYWTTFPPAPSGKLITIFLCLRYADYGWRPFGKRRFQHFYAEVMHRFREEAQVLCLPPLEKIERHHVEQWADTTVPSRSRYFDSSTLRTVGTKAFG